MERQINSPLAEVSRHYLVGNDKIKDIPDEQRIELIPTGFSHLDRSTSLHRQLIHTNLYVFATHCNTETSIEPLKGWLEHDIVLIPEKDNPFDCYAIRIDVKLELPTYELQKIFLVNSLNKQTHQFNLGYVPRQINRYISKNIDMFTGGHILSVSCNVHNKFYLARVSLSYGSNKTFKPKGKLSRFANVLE